MVESANAMHRSCLSFVADFSIFCNPIFKSVVFKNGSPRQRRIKEPNFGSCDLQL